MRRSMPKKERELISPGSLLIFGKENTGVDVMDEEKSYTTRLLASGVEGGSEVEYVSPLSEGTSSIYQVSCNFVNVVVGAGIVGLPNVFKQAGFALALLSMVCICLLTDYTVRLMIKTGAEFGISTYEDLCRHAFGRPGFILLCTLIFVFDYGAILTYTIILGDSASLVLKDFLGWNRHCTGEPETCHQLKRICILVCSVCWMLPFCLFRDISRLEKASAISVFSVVVIVVLVIAKLIEKVSTHGPDVLPGLDSQGTDIFTAFGVIAFSFVCHDSAFMLFCTLKNNTSQRWAVTTHLSLSTAVCICITFAVAGYLTFGDDVSDNILNDYSSSPAVVAMRLLYSLTMALTYPTGFFVARHILNAAIFDGEPPIQEASNMRFLSLTAALFLSSIAIALSGSSLGFIMALSGSGAGALAFVLPPLCRLKLCEVDVYERISLKALAFLGCALIVLCVAQACQSEFAR